MERDAVDNDVRDVGFISIHALRMERDLPRHVCHRNRVVISIHALRMERDILF